MSATKAERREQQRRTRNHKRVKHGIGKWKPKKGISKAWKKMVAKKITIKK